MQQRFAPVRTGRLRRSIVATYAGQSTPPHSQPGGGQVVPPLSVMVTAGNDEVRYAHLVEYGTAPHPNEGMFAGTEHPGAAPHPFFWPPYRALRKRMKSRVTREARKAIRKVVAG